MKKKLSNQKKATKKLVSVVIPAKDEEKTIGLVLKDLNKVIYDIRSYAFEVIVVDDGCRDRTAAIARKYKANVVENKGVHGKGKALACGFRHCKGDYIVMLDADYSHMPEDIPRFLQKLESGYGLVVGSRYTGGSDEYTLVRSFGNLVLTTAFVTMFGIHVSDALNGYKAFKREVITGKSLHAKDFEIEIELIHRALKLGYKIGEFPCHERERAGGKVKSIAFVHGPKFLWEIIKRGLRYRLGV